MHRAIVIALLLGHGLGCRAGSEQATAYVEGLRPLLYESGLLATTVIGLAVDAHEDRAPPATVRERWHEVVVPAASHLAWQAKVLEVPTAWREDHEALVGIWDGRARAYRDLDLAITTADRDAWLAAGREANAAQLAEEQWFKEVSRELSGLGLRIDPYPPPPVP